MRTEPEERPTWIRPEVELLVGTVEVPKPEGQRQVMGEGRWRVEK